MHSFKKIYHTTLKIISFLFIPLIIIFMFFIKLKILSYKTSSILFSLIPGEFGNQTRSIYYKITLKKVGANFQIFWASYIVYPETEIGDRVTIEEKCVISKCTIGDDVIIAANVSTMSGKNHHYVDDLSLTFYKSGGETKKIRINNNIWIGTHAVIMENVASGTVIGAGAVVTKEFPDNSIIGGVPARLIRARGEKN